MPKEKTLEEKLRFLQSQVRIGGKGTVRRKKKILHQTGATDDKKLQSALKKVNMNTIPGIEEVNIIKDDLSVIHFNNPKAQASVGSNTFAISGHGEYKKIVEMLPDLLPQLSHDNVVQLRRFAHNISDVKTFGDFTTDEDVPLLVEDFDEASKNEMLTVNSSLQAMTNSKKIGNSIKKQEFTNAFVQSLLEGNNEEIAKEATLVEITDISEPGAVSEIVKIPE